MTPLLVHITTANESEARLIAQTLVQEKLAACVQLVPGVESHYIWQGQAEVTTEILLLIKTESARWEELSQRVRALHSYQCPEIVAIPIERASADYLAWWEASLANGIPV